MPKSLNLWVAFGPVNDGARHANETTNHIQERHSMTYSTIQQAEQLLASTIDWSHAPKAIQIAKKTCDKTLAVYFDAIALAQDLKVEKIAIEAKWEADSRQAVRDGKPIPSIELKETARFKLVNAEADERIAESKNNGAIFELATLVADPAIRAQWIANLTDTLGKAQSDLSYQMATVFPLLGQIETESSLQVFLGEYSLHVSLPRVIDSNPSGALFAYLNANPWTPPQPLSNDVNWYETPEADTRPMVYLANAFKVDIYSAAEADQHLANTGERYRLATADEIARHRFLNNN